MRQLAYSIDDLEGMLGFDSAESVADALRALGVPMVYNQEPADLSGWKRGLPSSDGKIVAVRGKRLYPDPDDVRVASSTLPPDWQKAIEDAERDDPLEESPGATELPRHDKDEKDDPLHPRVRKNLLRIIAALAHRAGISLEPNRDGASKIEELLDECGFEQPREQTIRKFLTEAWSLSP